MDQNLRLADWYGRQVQVVIDRPLGSAHPEDDSFVYELNYGFIPGTTAPDGEPMDVYVIDAATPLTECEVEIIAVVRRRDDVEDKLVGRVGDGSWSADEIAKRTAFQEQWFDTFIQMAHALEPMKHGYTNHTVREGSTVLKTYTGPDSSERCDREVTALSGLLGSIPVPEIIESTANGMRTRWIPGIHGKDLLTSETGSAVLTACGRTLRQIHAIDASAIISGAPAGSTLVHGDYGPNNLLLDQATMEVVAVVDWEWAHPGRPVEDMAWCEWIVRTFHPKSINAMDAFYVAYGERPAWSNRQAAMLVKLRRLHRFAEQRDPLGRTVTTRLQQMALVESWTDLDESVPT